MNFFVWLFFSLQCLAFSQEPLGNPSSDQDGTSAGPLDSSFDEIVVKNMDHFRIPGLSIAVIDGNYTYAKVAHPLECIFTLN